MNKFILASSIFVLTVIFSFSIDSAFAHPHFSQTMINDHDKQTEIIALNEMIGLEKSTILFHAPQTNTLPWGFVEGTIANHVEGYPAIIQIFKNGDPVHFAQTGVNSDGTYEYKFRVLNSDNTHTTKIFEGNYSVKIFKVVYLNQNALV